MGLARPREERIFMKDIHKDPKLSQNKQMTELLADCPWIAEVQCQARQQVLSDLDKAWQRVFKSLSKRVKFKSKGDALRIYAPITTVPFALSGDRLTGKLSFESPKYLPLGKLKIVLDRPTAGKVKSWSIKREVDEWYAMACCESEVTTPETKNDKVVGIDRGVINVIADSDGRLVANPQVYKTLAGQLRRAQRQVSRKEKSSNNQKKARLKVARLARRMARQRENFIGTQSLYYARNYGKVVIEDLQIANMTASAKGTKENPGTNIRQKSGLNRSILDAGWGKFAQAAQYKLEERGGELVKVKAAFSSQTCPICGHVDENSRVSRDMFVCTKCGHTENADTSAAKVIKQRSNNAAQIKRKAPKKSMINRQGRKPKTVEAVKPTVEQPAEDNSTVASSNIDVQEPIEAGTGVREDSHYIQE